MRLEIFTSAYSNNMNTHDHIPKIIHYCWFGPNKKSELIQKCIQSWRDKLPGYEIMEWNENNFDHTMCDYSNMAYKEKKWAFVSDYARLYALYHHGGIYLDTDMYVLKSFDDFLDNDLVLGKEDDIHISAGMIACKKNNTYLKNLLDYYQDKKEYITIPRALTHVYENDRDNNIEKYVQSLGKVKIFDAIYFYPFTAEDIKLFYIDPKSGLTNAPDESYGVHMWNYSWGHPLVKLSKKLGIHRETVRILDKLKIKSKVKKLLRGI